MTGGRRPTRRPSRVRISAGRWKGRLLEVPGGARPTSSMAREALFDLLGARVAGARVLDLYAGSGAVGLESISRGASTAVLVDRDSSAIERSLERLPGAAASVLVIAADVGDALRRLQSRTERFDLVFCDPPYADPPAPLASAMADVLAPGGVLVFQRDARESPPRLPPLTVVSRRAYGRNVFYFLESAAPERL